jgi:hypothetical protein
VVSIRRPTYWLRRGAGALASALAHDYSAESDDPLVALERYCGALLTCRIVVEDTERQEGEWDPTTRAHAGVVDRATERSVR